MIFYSQKLPLFTYTRRLFHINFIFPLLFFSGIEMKAQWLYEIAGSVTNGSKKVEAAIITLYKGGTQVQQVTTPSNGKFVLRLDQEAEYELNVTKPGYITKKFLFSTKGVPSDIAKTFEGGAKPEISIFELPKDPEVIAQVNSILQQPMAKFLYDPTEQDIVFDKAYSQTMLQELNRLNQLEKETKKKQEEEAKGQLATVSALAGKYDAAIAKGDAAFAKKDYTNAKTAYQDALTIKKGETYPVSKIAEIEKLIAEADKTAQQETDYKAAIAKADMAFSDKKYEQAKGVYSDALKIKPKEGYPKAKIEEINKLLADADKNKDLEAKYEAIIAKADKAFETKTYELAKTSYTEALSLKSSEKYPKNRLNEIDRLLNEANAKNKSEKETAEKYNLSIAKADKAFGLKDYEIAKTAYKDALGIKPTEVYPKDKINEIDKMLAEIANKNASEKQLNASYATLISKADKLLSDKAYANAKTVYAEALVLKKAEQYPKDKIAEIDKLLAGVASKELEEKNRLLKESEINQKYMAFIAAGDKAMGGKDYASAKNAFTDALNLKSGEKYPKSKLEEIEKILATAAELDTKYKLTLAKADAAFKEKTYDAAKKSYKDALVIKSEEQYPKDRIAEIDNMIAKESAGKVLNDKYLVIISKADKSFEAKDFATSKTLYTEALGLKGNELYPKNKLAEIEKLLSDAANKNAVEKERLLNEKIANEKYLAAIAKADAAFLNKEYVVSKGAYSEALTVRPAEQYPKDRLKAIESLLDASAKELELKFKNVLSKADAAYASKDYQSARTAYSEALSIKNSETYPKDQISKIDLLMAEMNKENVLKQKYNEAIAKGDASLLKKDYSEALIFFREAQTMRPTESYPNTKITEINAALDALARGKEKDNQYKLIIEKADQLFAKKEYKVAKGNYLDALLIKPTEKYPKDKIAAIDVLLNNKTTSITTTAKRSADDFRNELAKKYPQGITEESGMDGNIKFIRRIVVKGEEAHLYLKKTTSFGAIYYFKDEVSITEADYIKETELSK